MRHLLSVGIASLTLASLPAHSAPAYRLTDLGVLDGYSQSFSYGLSDSGKFLSGWLQEGSTTRAFRWSAATGMELLTLGNGVSASRAFGVNDSGVVAGESVLSQTRREATLWSASNAGMGLGTLPNPGAQDFSSVAFGVNNAGTAAGWSDSTDDTRAFQWTSAVGMSSLGVLPGGTPSSRRPI